MARELLGATSYPRPLYSLRLDSLFYPSNRRSMGETEIASPEELVGYVAEALELKIFNPAEDVVADVPEVSGLTGFKGKMVGRNRILTILHANLHLPRFRKEDKTYVKLGVALETSVNHNDGANDPSKIIVRESEGFSVEDFASEAEELLVFDRRPRKLPAPAYSALSAGLVASIGGILTTGDPISAAAFGATGIAIALAGGDYVESVEQWELTQKVPCLEEYFAGDKAVAKLETIDNYLKTIKAIEKLEGGLDQAGIKLSLSAFRDYWEADNYMGLLIEKYNSYFYSENAASRDKSQAELLAQMVERIKHAGRYYRVIASDRSLSSI